MPLGILRRKRKRARLHEAPQHDPQPESSVYSPAPPPRAKQVHQHSDNTILTPSPVCHAIEHDEAETGAYDGTVEYLEELEDDDEYYPEAPTPPSFSEDDNVAPEDEDLVSRLLQREREYTRLQVYYEELHRRYADSKDQIAHLNRQVDVLSGRLERKEQRIRFLKLLVGRK